MHKYNKGDLVRVAKDLGPSMKYFEADCDAIVIDRDADSVVHKPQYTLFLKGSGECSWYEHDQLTLIKPQQLELLAQWQADVDEQRKQRSDLDWIFARGPAVLEDCSGVTAEALAKCLTDDSLWGLHGEGMDFYENARRVLLAATPFLKNNDKVGWLAHCAKFKAEHV